MGDNLRRRSGTKAAALVLSDGQAVGPSPTPLGTSGRGPTAAPVSTRQLSAGSAAVQDPSKV